MKLCSSWVFLQFFSGNLILGTFWYVRHLQNARMRFVWRLYPIHYFIKNIIKIHSSLFNKTIRNGDKAWIFLQLLDLLRCFNFINQKNCTFIYVLFTYFLTYFLPCLLDYLFSSLLTYLLLIPCIRGYYWTLTRYVSKTTISKLLIFCHGTFLTMIFVKHWQRGVKNWSALSGKSDHGTLDFIMIMYASFIFHNQINVICKKCYIAAMLTFFSVHANVYAPKFWKHNCSGVNPVTSLISTYVCAYKSQRLYVRKYDHFMSVICLCLHMLQCICVEVFE